MYSFPMKWDFPYSCSSIWHVPPVWFLDSFTLFKSLLKRHLFQEATFYPVLPSLQQNPSPNHPLPYSPTQSISFSSLFLFVAWLTYSRALSPVRTETLSSLFMYVLPAPSPVPGTQLLINHSVHDRTKTNLPKKNKKIKKYQNINAIAIWNFSLFRWNKIATGNTNKE